MSYCVNCGVELDRTAACCALCGTEVCNPSQPVDMTAPKPFPEEMQPPPPNNRPLIAGLLAALLSLPVLVCLVTNLVFGGGTWSVYPIGGIVLFWVLTAGPLLSRKPRPVPLIALDAFAVLVYLFVIAALGGQGLIVGLHWYLRLALPIVVVVAAATLFPVAYLRRYRADGLVTSAILFVDAGLALVGIELALSFFAGHPFQLSWSWIVLISCLAMSVALLIIDRSPHLLAELRRRLHV